MQISVEDDQGSIEYYAYLRSIMEIDQMSYWIGNPSVEIINGNITLAKLKGTCFEK